jgi:hypothetical protein
MRLLVAETFGQPPSWTDTLTPAELATFAEYALVRQEERARAG